MALYFLYSGSSVTLECVEGSLRQALDDKDSSVVFAALSVWKLILIVSNSRLCFVNQERKETQFFCIRIMLKNFKMCCLQFMQFIHRLLKNVFTSRFCIMAY
jgi:hypothetical protein